MTRCPDAVQLCVPIHVAESDGIERHCEPVRVGVPLGKGRLYDTANLMLLDGDDRALPHQGRALALWSDRSIKWLLLDTLVSIGARQRRTLFLRSGIAAGQRGGEPAQAVRIEERQGGWIANTGVATFGIGGKAGILLSSVSRDGVSLITAESGRLCLRGCSGREYAAISERGYIEESGPVRAAIVTEGYFAAPGHRSPLEFKTRLIFSSGSALVRLEIQVHNPQAAVHPGGLWDLDDHGTVLFEDLTFAISPAGSAHQLQWYAERPEEIRADAPDGWLLYQDSSGGENWDSENHVDGAGRSTVSFRGYRVSCRDSHGQMLIAEGDRATPCVRVAGDCGRIAATVAEFWQNFPKALRWSDGLLSVGLFPGECRAPFALQGGEQKRHTVLLEFLLPAENSSVAAQQRPLLVCIDPDALEASAAMQGLVAATRDTNAAYLRYIGSIIEGPSAFESKRELIDEYGWRHFGDLYADHEAVNHRGPRALISHYNNQYDFIYGALVHFLRSADARWWTLAQEAARHTIDIDLYHTDRDRAAFNHGLFWHTDHYKPAATCTHRTYSRRNGRGRHYGGGPSSEHNYTSGLLLYFYLSGDAEAAHAVRELADWVIGMDDGSRSILGAIDPSPTGLASKTAGYHQAGRGAGNSINALLDAYTLCGERRYLAKADELIRRCIHPADDIEMLRLSEPELRWSYLVFLQVLGKYLDLKLEWGERDHMFHYARASLLHYARWMAAHEVPYKQVLDRVALPTETWPAHDIRKCQVLHLAAKYAPKSERAALHARAAHFFDRSLADVLSFETAFLTRPRVILCVYGYSHAYFQAHATEGPDLEEPSYSFGRPEVFIPQRQRWRTALPAKFHLLVAMLVRMSVERLSFLGRRSSPLRI